MVRARQLVVLTALTALIWLTSLTVILTVGPCVVSAVGALLVVDRTNRRAFWNEHKTGATFSPLFFRWFNTPVGRPVLDVLLSEDEDAGQLICQEIHRRWQKATLRHDARPPETTPARLPGL